MSELNENQILLDEIFKELADKDRLKVKFNMNYGDVNIKALNLLLDDDHKWYLMNAHKERNGNHNLDRCDYLLSFAQYYPYGKEYFLYGGFFKVNHEATKEDATDYVLEELDQFKQYKKRLVIKLKKPLGQSYNRTWYNLVNNCNPEIYEILPNPKLKPFLGFNSVSLTHEELQIIFKNLEPDWKNQLSSVKGIYCVTDRESGKLYIGSAYNNDGIWGRWKSYADINNLTGGNKIFTELKFKDENYIVNNFTYSILEIFDPKTKDEYIIERENHWKRVFDSIKHGMNRN